MDVSGLAFSATALVFTACAAAFLARLIISPGGADKLTMLAAISALVLGVLVMLGARSGRPAFLDVALVYDIFGFLGILAIATFTKDAEKERAKEPDDD
jgi:multicomponent Na+:H+ antiporter subunit F